MKRLLTLALAGALMSSVLVGCGGNDDTAPSEDTGITEVTDEKKDESSKEEKDKAEDKKEEESKDSESEEITSLTAWNGDWNNMGAYLDKEEIQLAYEKIAEKEGTSAEEEKEKYIEKRKTDFDGMSIEGEKITLYDGFKSDGANEIASSEYTYKGTEKTKMGRHDLVWSIFEANDESAPYKYFLMMPVHGEDGLKHFHLRYGNEDPKELLEKESWFPTMIVPESTTEQIIEEMTE